MPNEKEMIIIQIFRPPFSLFKAGYRTFIRSRVIGSLSGDSTMNGTAKLQKICLSSEYKVQSSAKIIGLLKFFTSFNL